jgi:hypothetical protein
VDNYLISWVYETISYRVITIISLSQLHGISSTNPYDYTMTHECSYQLDLDGSITCSICGAMDDDMCHSDDMDNSLFETQVNFE